MARRPWASPAPRVSAAGNGSGPRLVTASASDGPAMYAVASHGVSDVTSASSTSAVNRPLTLAAARTSRANRVRKPGSSASSGRITFTATSAPVAERPRYTCPIPPEPSRSSKR